MLYRLYFKFNKMWQLEVCSTKCYRREQIVGSNTFTKEFEQSGYEFSKK